MQKMKDSGVEWIGEIPEHWDIKRLKYAIPDRCVGAWGEEEKGGGDGYICLRVADFDYPKMKFADKDISELTRRSYKPSTIRRLKLKKNDLIIEKSGGGEKTPVGRSVLFTYDYPAVYSNFLEKLSLNEFIKPKWMLYVLNTFYNLRYIKNFINQTTGIQNLDLNKLLNQMAIPVPILEEQQIIIDFLDFKCSKIDSLVDKIQSEIDVLQQYRKSVIYEAVTKGLNPNVEMKDSEENWLGSIPAHWEITRVASLYSERNESGNPDLPVLMVSINSGVSDSEVSNEDRMRSVVQSEDKTKYKRVFPDDLVYNMMRAWQGAFGAVRVDGLVSPAYVVAKPKQQLDSRYIEALFRTPAAISEMKRFSYGIADFRLRLYWQYFRNIRLCLPPLEEQKRIADFVEERSNKINAVIVKKQEQLSVLADYKKSLIYEYVTGKKEVPAS